MVRIIDRHASIFTVSKGAPTCKNCGVDMRTSLASWAQPCFLGPASQRWTMYLPDNDTSAAASLYELFIEKTAACVE
jgi:hypothetical protein